MWLSVLKMARWGVCGLMNSCRKIINAVPPFLQPLPPLQNTVGNICASQQPSCKTPFPALHRTTVRWTSTHAKGKTYKTLQKMSCVITKSQMLSVFVREDRRELGLGRTCSGAVWMGGKREGGDKRRLLSLQAFGPTRMALKITWGEGGVISDFLVSHPGTILKTMNRIAQAPFRGDSCKHLVQPFWFWCVRSAYQIWSPIPCSLLNLTHNNIYLVYISGRSESRCFRWFYAWKVWLKLL